MTNQTINIPIYQPYLSGNEKKYVNDCLDSNWISSKGEYIAKFEQGIAGFVKSDYATSVCNGTVALHLALMALGIEPGDEIIVPTLTYVASINSIVHAGAVPVFVDSLESTWQMDPLQVLQKITPKTRAVMAVHLYGHPCEMAALKQICDTHQLYLIEDCAEAFGTLYANQHVGTFGDIAAFSFYGNKTITTGEGGAVVAQNKKLHDRCVLLKTQGVDSALEYWHGVIGYNYRMTNLCAAIGLAQLEQIDTILRKKRVISQWYNEDLENLPLNMHTEIGDIFHSYWMISILLNDGKQRDSLRGFLKQSRIETRPFFYPAHTLPMFANRHEKFPVAESLSSRGINLPSWPGLTREQVQAVSMKIREFFK